ncbi:unnamed protein product [Rotaria sp. Silwood2]|nr:unnamed protein product [Rotaria sp. Silwood2]CAF3056357.1 unnamed protein product [Rotaria sp. Silwood2]CAF3312394.1 unnamed protein product [Rotaria sp. Silwood2]CAF3388394.1 unnamed protein product [Rotaria sp. Silwood2]CAF4275543.1 unnamed protein product [Rotaria sp. Silwood2]
MLFCLFIISSIFIPIQTISIEDSNSTTIFRTDKLSRVGLVLDFRILPYIGNGHIATVVYSDFIYMSGLYNGENGRKIVVPVKVHEQTTSVDINFTVATRNPQYVLLVDKTREIENNQFQPEALPVFVYYTPLPHKGLELDKRRNKSNISFLLLQLIIINP